MIVILFNISVILYIFINKIRAILIFHYILSLIKKYIHIDFKKVTFIKIEKLHNINLNSNCLYDIATNAQLNHCEDCDGH